MNQALKSWYEVYTCNESSGRSGIQMNELEGNLLTSNKAEEIQSANGEPRLVEISSSIDPSEGYIPQTVYWLYVQNRPVAYGKLRHQLTDRLMNNGGHVGYIVKPSERGKGYGKLFLKAILQEAQSYGMTRMLLTCPEHHIASRKVIEHNNGHLECISGGICKYWIIL